jgi:hypothetical protein
MGPISGESLTVFLQEWFKGKGYQFSVGYGIFDNTLEATLFDPSTNMYHQYRVEYEKLTPLLTGSHTGLFKEMTEALQASLDASYSAGFICSVTQKPCTCDGGKCNQRKQPSFVCRNQSSHYQSNQSSHHQ